MTDRACDHNCCDRCREFDELQRNERAMAVLHQRVESRLAHARAATMEAISRIETILEGMPGKTGPHYKMANCSCTSPNVCPECEKTAKDLAGDSGS